MAKYAMNLGDTGQLSLANIVTLHLPLCPLRSCPFFAAGSLHADDGLPTANCALGMFH